MFYLLGLIFLICFALFKHWRSTFTYTEKERNHLAELWFSSKITLAEYNEYMSDPIKYKPKADHPFNQV